jgi:hypothetical protein
VSTKNVITLLVGGVKSVITLLVGRIKNVITLLIGRIRKESSHLIGVKEKLNPIAAIMIYYLTIHSNLMIN